MAHHRHHRRGAVAGPASSSGPAGTIWSVVSGLMVSLVVVVAAILAVVFLVFSDQPATERFRSLRGDAVGPAPSPPPSLRPAPADSESGPPPASVLQAQLALPSLRRATAAPGTSRSGPPSRAGASASMRTGPQPALSDGGAIPATSFDLEAISFWARLRSSAALLALLTAVGTVVALGIGAAMFLASLALRHALR
jgi:hypothetical protein